MLLQIHWRSKMTAWNLTLQILPTSVAILLISGLLRAAGGTFDPPHHLLNPIRQLARSLSLSQRQRQRQVCCASDGGGVRAPLLIQPGPGVPVLPLSSRIGNPRFTMETQNSNSENDQSRFQTAPAKLKERDFNHSPSVCIRLFGG